MHHTEYNIVVVITNNAIKKSFLPRTAVSHNTSLICCSVTKSTPSPSIHRLSVPRRDLSFGSYALGSSIKDIRTEWEDGYGSIRSKADNEEGVDCYCILADVFMDDVSLEQ